MSRLTIDEVKGAFADAINRVASESERIILHRQGKDVAVLVPMEDLAWLEETEEKLDVEEAERRLADPAEKPIPYEQARKEKSVAKRQMTARDLLESGLVGIWEDRTDIGDSLSFARKLRERAQRRSGK